MKNYHWPCCHYFWVKRSDYFRTLGGDVHFSHQYDWSFDFSVDLWKYKFYFGVMVVRKDQEVDDVNE